MVIEISKKALIVFPDEWIKYSPTILNAIECLRGEYTIKVLCFDNERFRNKDKFSDFYCIRIPKKIRYVLQKLDAQKLVKFLLLVLFLIPVKMKDKKYDLVLGIDSIGYSATCFFYRNVVFLSLEICNDVYMTLCRFLGIKHLVIQTEERKRYILGDLDVKAFFVQNAPIVENAPLISADKRKRLLFMGRIDNGNSLESIIGALYYLPQEYTITIGGIFVAHYVIRLKDLFSDLCANARLLFHETYVEQEELVNFVSDYYISFSLYDFSSRHTDDFNFISSPSGKVFTCIAAGVPAIVNDIVGMSLVKETRTGVLLHTITSETITSAILEIEENYTVFASNCSATAIRVDFKIAFDHFLKYWNAMNSEIIG